MKQSTLDLLLNSEIADMPPWKFVTTKQLTNIIDVHPQTAANWRHRDVGPMPAPADWFKGRAIRYRIGHLLSWAYEEAGRAKLPSEIYGEWLRDYMGFEQWTDRVAVTARVEALMKTGGQFCPADLRRAGRTALGI